MPKTSVFYTKPAYGHMGKMQREKSSTAPLCKGMHQAVGDGASTSRNAKERTKPVGDGASTSRNANECTKP